MKSIILRNKTSQGTDSSGLFVKAVKTLPKTFILLQHFKTQ